MLTKTKNKIYHALKKSEKWTKTDMIYLAKGGSWLTINKLVSSFFALILSVLYANYLSKEEYGLYKYVLSIGGLLSVFTLNGVNISLSRSISLGYEGTILKAIKEKIKWGLIGTFIGIIFAAYYFFNNNILLGASILASSIFSILIQSTIVHGAYLNGKKLFKISSIVNIINQFITFAIIFLLVITGNITILIISYFIFSFFIQLLLSLFVYKKYKPNKKQDESLLSYGKHLSLINFIGLVSEHIDKIFIWHFLSPIKLSIYSFSLLPVIQIKSVMRSINPLAMPKLAKQDIMILKKTLPSKIFKLFIISLAITFLYYFSSPSIFKVLFPKYMDSVKYTQILIFTIIFYPISLLSSSLVAHAKKKSLYYIRLLTPIIKILSMLALIPSLGIYGMIISIYISKISNSALLFYFFKKAK